MRKSLRELGICDVGLATLLERSGSFYEAERAAAEAVQVFEQIHFAYGAASASQWLGYSRLTRGYFVRARADLERAVRDARLARFTQTEAWARTDLADLYFALGDAESARAQAERASALHSSYGDLWGFAVDLQFEGFVAEARGSFDEACAKYTQSVAAFARAGLTFNAVSSLKLLAIAQMRAGRLDSAQRALDEGTRLARASANSGWQVELPVHLARLAMLRGDFQTADSLVAVARPRFPWRTGDQHGVQTMPFAALEAQLALREHRVATADSAVAYLSAAIALRRRVMSNDDLRAGLAATPRRLGRLERRLSRARRRTRRRWTAAVGVSLHRERARARGGGRHAAHPRPNVRFGGRPRRFPAHGGIRRDDRHRRAAATAVRRRSAG